MSNDFYSHSTYPSTGSLGTSSAMRSELDSVAAGFDKMPALTGNGSKIIGVNSGGTALEALTTTGTGSAVRATSPTLVAPLLGIPTSGTLTNCTGLPIATGVDGLGTGVATFLATPSSANFAAMITDETGTGVVVLATSPTLVTPALGVASATSINKLAITAPASGSTLTIADGKTLTASNTLTLTGTDASSVAFGTGGTVAYVANKLSAFAPTTSAELRGVISDETGTGVAVFNDTPTLVTPVLGVATATTINKVALTAPASGATLTIPDGVTMTGPAASGTVMTLGNTETVTGVKTFGSAGAVGRLKVAGTTSGTTVLDATAVASGTLTLPAATDTLVGKATTDTLTNKRVSARTGSTTSSATPTINTDNVDVYRLTAQLVDITSFTSNLTGTPAHDDVLIIEITGTAARAITWGASFESSSVSLPSTTVSTNMLTVGFVWNAATSKWRCATSF